MLALPSKTNYEGPTLNAQPHGVGKYTFATGNYYEGEFKHGEFHGDGILHVVGKGKMRGTWEHGKLIGGQFEFRDGLAHAANEWTYCTEKDRRYWNPEDQSDTLQDMLNCRPHKAPLQSGRYDCINGQLDSEKGELLDYETGEVIRTMSESEQLYIKAHAFKQP